MTQLPPKFAITPEQIDDVVAVFYEKVRKDQTLGPVFANHVSQWPEHEEKIAGFWRNAICHERKFDGNPQATHMAAGDIKAEHFAVWLAIFDETLTQELPAQTAASWSALAHRIGRAFKMSIESRDAPKGTPPKLF
jgi:hemoglobin